MECKKIVLHILVRFSFEVYSSYQQARSTCKMAYFVVYLIKSKRYLAVQGNWIEFPIVGQESKVFISADTNVLANLNSRIGYYVNSNANACYEAYVYKEFDSLDAAEQFASKKRLTPPIQYKTLQKFDFEASCHPVEFLEISDDMIEDENASQSNDSHVRFVFECF